MKQSILILTLTRFAARFEGWGERFVGRWFYCEQATDPKGFHGWNSLDAFA